MERGHTKAGEHALIPMVVTHIKELNVKFWLGSAHSNLWERTGEPIHVIPVDRDKQVESVEDSRMGLFDRFLGFRLFGHGAGSQDPHCRYGR